MRYLCRVSEWIVRDTLAKTYLTVCSLLQTILKYAVVKLPYFEIALVAAGEDEVLLRVEIKRPDFGAVCDDCLYTVLGGEVPKLDKRVLRRGDNEAWACSGRSGGKAGGDVRDKANGRDLVSMSAQPKES